MWLLDPCGLSAFSKQCLGMVEWQLLSPRHCLLYVRYLGVDRKWMKSTQDTHLRLP